MVFRVEVEMDSHGVERKVERLEAELAGASRDVVARVADGVHRRAARRFTAGGGAPGWDATRRSIRSRSGHLRQSLLPPTVEQAGPVTRATVGFRRGTVNKYAAMIERGKQGIAPKSARLLAIPVGPALTPAGNPRYGSPREVINGFWTRGHTGAPVFLARIGKRLQMLFVGRRRVDVPAFEPLQQALKDERPEIRGIVSREVEAAKSRAGMK